MAASPTSASATAGNVPSAGSAPATGAVLPTVTNFQQTAGQNIQNAGATGLAQIAAAGSKGQAAIQQAQQQNAAAKTAAIQAIMARGALSNAGPGNNQANEQTGVAPLVSRAQDLAATGANYEANNQGLQAANANYFAGLQGALPIDNAAIQTDINNDQSKNASAATAANLKLATENLAYQTALAKQGAGQTPAQILAQLGPTAQIQGQNLNQAASGLENPGGAPYGAPPTGLGTDNGPGSGALGPGGIPDIGGGGGAPPVVAGQSYTAPMSQSDAYGKIDAALGLPPGTSQAVAGNAESSSQTKANALAASNAKANAPAPAQTSAQITAQVRGASDYPQALNEAETALQAKGATAGSVIASIVKQYGVTPAQAYVIVNDAVGLTTKVSNAAPVP